LPPVSADAATTTTTVLDEPAPGSDVVALPDAPPGGAIVDGRANQLILVVDSAALSMTVVQVDGTLVTTLSGDADEALLQPVWSPDGRRIAWARSPDGAEWELVHAAVDGSDEQVVALPGRPDYLAFDPTASRVTALTPSPVGFGLVVVELASAGVESGDSRVVDIGQPYFTDFAPDGERVVAHVGSDVRVLDVTAPDTTPVSLAGPSTTHQTPQWHPSEDVVVYTVDDEAGGGELVQHAMGAERASPIADFDAFVLFDLDPSGSRLAVSSFAAPSGSGTPQAVRQEAGLPAGLSVVDLADGAAVRLADEPTSAPLWDPTGRRVLVRDSLAGVGRWSVHHVAEDELGPTVTEPFSVDSSQMPLYLRFWDQYVRTHSLWSPDGEHFVHVGTAADGRSGVWIHDADTSGASAYLTAGDFALWSPT
jgi:hypothetical protein